MDIKQTLFALSDADSVGNIDEAAALAEEMLAQYCRVTKTDNLSVIGFLKGERDYTLMLDAHIDQISMVVTHIDDNGFLTVSNAGGIDIRALPSRRVTIHGRKKITGVFASVPPHLAKGEEVYDDISKIKLDTLLGARAKELVSIGDFVTLSGGPERLLGTRVTGRSFDNRASVAVIIEIAKRLMNKTLPFNVAFVLSDGEELGLRGSKTATFKVNPQEAIVLDVSFGDGPGISGEESGELGKGGMIGISPMLDRRMSQRLMDIAKENGIPYQTEVMGRSTGTNADVVSVTREGVRTVTLSVPLRNMHSDVEALDLKDLEGICDLVCRYILSGGVMND